MPIRMSLHHPHAQHLNGSSFRLCGGQLCRRPYRQPQPSLEAAMLCETKIISSTCQSVIGIGSRLGISATLQLYPYLASSCNSAGLMLQLERVQSQVAAAQSQSQTSGACQCEGYPGKAPSTRRAASLPATGQHFLMHFWWHLCCHITQEMSRALLVMHSMLVMVHDPKMICQRASAWRQHITTTQSTWDEPGSMRRDSKCVLSHLVHCIVSNTL